MARRLFSIAIITTILTLTAAAFLWKIRDNILPIKPGGVGTKVVRITEIAPEVGYPMIYTTQMSTPLSRLLPDDWERRERRIVVEKSKRILSVYSGDKRVKSYFTALGFHPTGPKTMRDDGRTPEGTYYVCSKNPRSSFELSVRISYPGVSEAENGFRQGLIDERTLRKIKSSIAAGGVPPQDTRLGGDICIHGGGIGEIADDFSKARIRDWTQGCMAMRSEDIREVFDFAKVGTVVVIRP